MSSLTTPGRRENLSAYGLTQKSQNTTLPQSRDRGHRDHRVREDEFFVGIEEREEDQYPISIRSKKSPKSKQLKGHACHGRTN